MQNCSRRHLLVVPHPKSSQGRAMLFPWILLKDSYSFHLGRKLA